MGRSPYKFHKEQYPYFITSILLEELPIFGKPQIAQIIPDQFVFLQQQRAVIVYAFVIMGNHFHAVVQGQDLSKKLRLAKSFTARQILEILTRDGHARWLKKLKWNKKTHKVGRTFQVWQEGLHPKQLSSIDMVRQKMGYIHVNPVRAGFVDEPQDWRYSSARNYLGLEGLIPVTIFEG